MRRRRSGCILMALGVVVALAAGVVTFFIVAQSTAPKAVEVPKHNVLVAVVNIPGRTVINPSMIKVQQWPIDVIPPGALSNIEDGSLKFTLSPIYAGQAVIQNQVADTNGSSGTAFALEKGKVLVAVNFSSATAIVSSGAVKVGDSVDLIINTPGIRGNQVAPTLQNLKIFAMGSVNSGATKNPVDTNGSATATLFVFEVSPQDALILKFLETVPTDMVLRPAGDDSIVPTEPVSIDYIINKYRLQRPSSLQ